jgi:hypothetical protein
MKQHTKKWYGEWIGGRVDPRPGMDNREKRKFLSLPGLEL